MKSLTLVVDERELSTIQAALLLLQEQISALPEDLADMMRERGPAMTEKEIGKFARRLALADGRRATFYGAPIAGRLVGVDRATGVTVTLK